MTVTLDEQPAAPVRTTDDRYRTLLEISHAITAHLSLTDVLDVAAVSLGRLLPVDFLGVVTAKDGTIQRQALYVTEGLRRTGESADDLTTRLFGVTPAQMQEPATRTAIRAFLQQLETTRQPVLIEGLADTASATEMECRLAAAGFGAFAKFPVFLRDELLGFVDYGWQRPRRFSEEDVSILQHVTTVIGTAVANAVAYEEIRSLRDQLQAENVLLREELTRDPMFEEIVGASPALERVLYAIGRVAPSEATVLLLGETGTGKELLARAIHQRSPRAARPMIKVNCAALPVHLIASELFGHEKGAFTGALQRRAGRFELASGGTLFLDEVGELPLDVQASLLRVLQEGEFERVGGTQTLRTNARLVAATNRDLRAAVGEGRFREDLYYRLNVFPVVCPPLRERRDDIPLLVEYFVTRFARRMGRRVTRLDRESVDRLVQYAWPGNVRELQNIIERAMILGDAETFRVPASMLAEPLFMGADAGGSHWPAEPARRVPPPSVPALLGPASSVHAPLGHVTSGAASLPVSGAWEEDQERRRIEEALAQSRGRISGQSGAALKLGVPASTLEARILRLRIDKFRFRLRP